MMSVPAADLDEMFERLGHALYEYDGLAEALYAHERETTKAAPMKERPRFVFGVKMSLASRSVVQPVRLGIVLRKAANCA